MSTASLTPHTDPPKDDEERKSTTTVILPVAGGLPNRVALRSRPEEKKSGRRSRTWRNFATGGTTGILYGGTYWVDPTTWVDGSMYNETVLKRQFVQNFQQIPHLFGVLQEDMVDPDFGASPYFKPVLPELTVPLG